MYFVDVVGTEASVGGAAVATWTVAGLVGGVAVLRLLRRVSGARYLRASAVLSAGLFGALLLAPGAATKLVLLALLGIVNAGWYPVLQARLYAALPGQSGAAPRWGASFTSPPR